MCNCKSCSKGDGENIALAFKDNGTKVKAVMTKYGMAHMEPTPENVMIGAVAFGPSFLTEASKAAAGIDSSANYTGDEEKQFDLASSIFGIIGTAAGAGIDITKAFLDIKNSGKGNANTQQAGNQNGNPTVVYVPTPQQPQQPARTFGFTNGQLGLLLLAGALLVGVVVYFANKEK